MRALVTMRTASASTYHEARDAISHDWIERLEAWGVTPILIPNAMSDPKRYIDDVGADALLLTSGDDVAVPLGEGPPDSPTQRRDRTEATLVRECIDARVPILGVCRGMQFLNVYFGGSLTRRLPSGHVATRHAVTLSEDIDGLRSGTRFEVNSYHDHGILPTDLAADLTAVAVADDGSVEALRHRSLPILAIQWHPERVGSSERLDRAVLATWSGP